MDISNGMSVNDIINIATIDAQVSQNIEAKLIETTKNGLSQTGDIVMELLQPIDSVQQSMPAHLGNTVNVSV